MNMTKAENAAIAEQVFPKLSTNINKLRTKRGFFQKVYRLAPSPTGEMHIGTLLIAVINYMMVLKHKGRFILRIEDTDQERKEEGATEFIMKSLARYGIKFHESPEVGGKAGPYIQSMRQTLYHCCAKKMLLDGTAYVDFQTPTELKAMRVQQEKRKIPIGLYGGFSKWRNANFKQVQEALAENRPYVIRYYNPRPYSTRKISYDDAILGKIELAPYIWDEVIIKSDGLPTYHAAHVWDDVLMGVTHVLRGKDWLNSFSLHLMLYQAFGYKPATYGHIPTIDTKEGTIIKKLSKRKNDEAKLNTYEILGIPKLAILEYLMWIATPKFEEWRKKHGTESIWNFPINDNDLKKKQGPLFDFTKVYYFSKEVIANFSAQQLFKEYDSWSKTHDVNFHSILENEPKYSMRVFGLGKSGSTRRKDIVNYNQVQYYLGNMFDEVFYKLKKNGKSSISENTSVLELNQIGIEPKLSKHVLVEFHKNIRANGIPGNSQDMMNMMREIQAQIPETQLNSVLKVVRVALFGRTETPDLFEIMSILQKDRVLKRVQYVYKQL